MSLTYKAGSGQQTHFILDVTGYFLNNNSGADVQRLLTPVRVLDTRFGTGLANKFQANTNRTFQVAGRWDDPRKRRRSPAT